VVHTHSVWSAIVSEVFGPDGGVALRGFEILKGLAGVLTHAHEEWLPIVGNSQDWGADAQAVVQVLRAAPRCHGFLIRRHGLYTWGHDPGEAGRHLEVLEFLLEVVGRSLPPPASPSQGGPHHGDAPSGRGGRHPHDA
jgi:methylthioribulose-1-phosphate dehydratase